MITMSGAKHIRLIHSRSRRYITHCTPESVDDVLKVVSGEIFTSGFVMGSSNRGAITPAGGALWVILDMPPMLITITTFQQITPRHAFHPASICDFQEQGGAGMV